MRQSALALAVTALLLAVQARAQTLPELLKGRWTPKQTAHAAPPSGWSWRATSCAASTLPATWTRSRSSSAGRPGSPPRASLRAQPVRRARSGCTRSWAQARSPSPRAAPGVRAELVQCHDPLAANTPPQQLIETIYARYAASNEAGLPLSSPANLHAFFVTDLADMVVAFASHTGRVADDCRPGRSVRPPVRSATRVSARSASWLPR